MIANCKWKIENNGVGLADPIEFHTQHQICVIPSEHLPCRTENSSGG